MINPEIAIIDQQMSKSTDEPRPVPRNSWPPSNGAGDQNHERDAKSNQDQDP